MPLDRAPVELPHKVRMRILGAVMVGVFLAALDQTVVGTALPRIITDLRGNELYTWAITAYLLTSTISGPVYGKLSDLFGRRPIFLFGVATFMLGSLLCGLSQEMWQLILFRAIQGLGAGALFPIALAVIGDLFAPSERGRYQGLFGAVFGLSILIGPAIGGIITDTIGWHWVFFVNLPIGAFVLYMVWRYLPSYHLGTDKVRIDYLGAVLFAAALVPILVGLTNMATGDCRGHQRRWLHRLRPAGPGRVRVRGVPHRRAHRAAGACSGCARSRSRSWPCSWRRSGSSPRSCSCRAGSRSWSGSSATESGYQILPLLGGLIVSAVMSGQIVARTGRYKWLIFGALIVMAIGLFLLSTMTRDTPVPQLWLYMLITGLGVGPTFAVFTLIVQNSVPVQQLGTATANLTFFQQVGGTVGLAITGSIFASALRDQIPRQLATANLPPEVTARSPAVASIRTCSRAWATWAARSWAACRPTHGRCSSRTSAPSWRPSTARSPSPPPAPSRSASSRRSSRPAWCPCSGRRRWRSSRVPRP